MIKSLGALSIQKKIKHFLLFRNSQRNLTAVPQFCACNCIILSHSKIAALSWYSGQTAWREEPLYVYDSSEP